MFDDSIQDGGVWKAFFFYRKRKRHRGTYCLSLGIRAGLKRHETGDGARSEAHLYFAKNILYLGI